MQYSKILAISFLVTILLCGTDAFETKESKERNNKLYQTLANAQPKHATTKDPIHSSTQKKNIQKTKTLESGLYNVLANIKEGKMKRRNMTSLSARHAMIRPTEPPTRGTRPTRPTRPTPPTRPTRATNCPCNQNCQSCGCTCHKKQIKQNIHARKTMPGSRKTITTPRNLTEIFRKKLLKSRNETDSRKRDFMNEVLDSSVFSTGHAPSQWQDFYDNGAKWDQYEAPQVHHDRKINFEDPNYKVSLGFTDGGHELMEHANEIANNHVEAYPGEIVSGENYLSKFVSPVEQDTRRPCSRGRRNYGYDKKRYRIKGERYDPCSREMTEVTKTDKENTRAVFNTLSGFMTPFNSFDSDQDGPQKGNRRHEFNSRDRNLDRPDEESESDERRHHDDRDRDEHGSQAPFRGNERFRVRGDRHPDGRHFHDEENRDNEYEDERQDARNRNVRVENREQDVETKNENHFVDKQHFNEDGPREEEERYDEGENEREGEEERNFSNEGEKMTREEDMTSRFLPDEQGTSRDNLLDSNGRPMRYEKSDEVVGKFLQQTKEGDQEKSLEEKANSQQEEGDEKESALVEEQHGEVPETEVDEGAARRSESEISNRVKGMLSMIEGTDKMGSPEERKAIQKIMDASNRENELLAKSFASNVEKKVLSGKRRSSEITETGNPHVSTISNYENKLLSLKHENDFATPGNHHEKEFAELSPTGGDSSISQLLGTPMNDEKISQLPEGLTETMGSAKSLITTKVAGLSFQRSLLKSLADVTPPTKQSTPGLLSSFKSQTKNDMSNLKEHLKLFMLHLNEKGTKNPDVEKQFLSHTAISSIINEVQKADHNLLNGKSKIRTKILNSKNKL